MKIVHNPDHHLHAPQTFIARGRLVESKELPQRADFLSAGIAEQGHEIVRPADYGMAPLQAVHSRRYLDFLRTGYGRWAQLQDASPEIVPNVHPMIGVTSYPDGIVGQAGFHLSDTACPVGAGTWQAVSAGAQAARHAAGLVANGEHAAYVLTRPPGHHAGIERAGGFCFLNNTAVAAAWLATQAKRVAIVDVDVHHGNGTQEIFYHRSDILHVSLHADPSNFYPFFSGYAGEEGEGAGRGFNVNIPLPFGTDDAKYLAALEQALQRVMAFKAEVLVVALGLDIYEKDPLRAFSITDQGFAEIGCSLASLGLPTVLVQEGGYLAPELGSNLNRFLRGFESKRG